MKYLIFLSLFGLNSHLLADQFSYYFLMEYIGKEVKGVIQENNEPCGMIAEHSIVTMRNQFYGFGDDPNDYWPHYGLTVAAGTYPYDSYAGFQRPKQNIFLYHNHIIGAPVFRTERVITIYFDSELNITKIEYNDDNKYKLNCIIKE